MSFLQTLVVTCIATGTAFLASFLTNQAALRNLRVQFELESRREWIKKRNEMIEQTYNLLFNLNGVTITRHLAFVSLLKEQISWEYYLQSVNDIKSDADSQLGIIEIRINQFFPELIPSWEEVNNSFREMAEQYVEYAHAKEQHLPIGPILLLGAPKIAARFFNAIKRIKKEIIALPKTA